MLLVGVPGVCVCMAWVSAFLESQGTHQCGVGVGVRHCRMPWTAQIVWLNSICVPVDDIVGYEVYR